MRAAICKAYGEPEAVVDVIEVPSPQPGADDVRVKVHAAAVNFPDVLLLANKYQISVPAPFIPGSEYAGEVVEVGDSVSQLSVGDRVFGSTMVGAFAEEIVVSAGGVTRTPPAVSDNVAAAFGVAYRTAYHVLRTTVRLQPGEELVVLGAGGGVGSAAVQLGALLGATVTAVASTPEKLEAARSCGAHRAIQYGSGDLRQAFREALPDGVDVVVDPVGGDVAEPALRALRWGGRFVTVGYASGTIPRIPLNLVLLKGISILGFEMRGFGVHRRDEMARDEQELLELLADGRAVPLIGATFELNDAAAALRHVADGRALGKVVVEISPDSSSDRRERK